MHSIKYSVAQLYSELQENKGIMPDTWKPYAALLIAVLKIAKIFTSDKIDQIIDEIIAAIELAEVI